MKDWSLEHINQVSEGKLSDLLDIKITNLEKGRVEATMPVDSRHHQPMGILHGGASLVLAETVASIGGWYLVGEQGQWVVGQEINANHLRPKKSGMLYAEGQVLHQGNRSQVWEITIRDKEKKLVCISRCTLAVVSS